MDLLSHYEQQLVLSRKCLSLIEQVDSLDLQIRNSHFERAINLDSPKSSQLKQSKTTKGDSMMIQEIEESRFLTLLRDKDVHYQKIDNDVLQVSYFICLENLEYDIYVKLTLNYQLDILQIESIPMKNGLICRVIGSNVIKSLSRKFLFMNAKLAFGSLCICYNTGQYSLKSCHSYDLTGYKSCLEKFFEKQTSFYEELNSIKGFWEKNLPIIERLSRPQNQAHSQNIERQIDMLSSFISRSYIEEQFMFSNTNLTRSFPLNADEIHRKQRSYRNDIKFFNNKPLDSKCQQIIQNYRGKKHTPVSYDPKAHLEKTKELIETLMSKNYSKLKVKNKQTSIFGKIHIVRILRELKISDTVNSVITLYSVEQKLEDKIVRKDIIGKISKEPQRKNQLNIIQSIKDQKCPFIARFYESDHQALEKQLLLEYCSLKTLNNFLESNKLIVSFEIKIFLLYQVCIGLKFLRDHKIIHLDIKPQNVLVRMFTKIAGNDHFRSLMLRIIDFGTSLKIPAQKNQFQRPYTIPYCDPWLIERCPVRQLSQKSDVFSFGVLGMEIIFGHYTYDLRRKKEKAYKNQNFKKFLSICHQKTHYSGYKPLMDNLFYLFLRCLDQNSSKRPSLDWIFLIIKQCIKIQEQLYRYDE